MIKETTTIEPAQPDLTGLMDDIQPDLSALDEAQPDLSGTGDAPGLPPEEIDKRTTSTVLGGILGMDPDAVYNTYNHTVLQHFKKPLSVGGVRKTLEDDGYLAIPEGRKDDAIQAAAVSIVDGKPLDPIHQRNLRRRSLSNQVDQFNAVKDYYLDEAALEASSKPSLPADVIQMELADNAPAEMNTIQAAAEAVIGKTEQTDMMTGDDLLEKVCNAKSREVAEEYIDAFKKQSRDVLKSAHQNYQAEFDQPTLEQFNPLEQFALAFIQAGYSMKAGAYAFTDKDFFTPEVEEARSQAEAIQTAPIDRSGAVNFVANTLGQVLPTTLTSIMLGSAAAGAATTQAGARFLMGIGAGLSGYITEKEFNKEELLSQGVSEEQAEKESTLVGLINAPLEFLQVDAVMDFMTGGRNVIKNLSKTVSKSTAKKMMDAGGRLTRQGFVLFNNEGITEALQEIGPLTMPAVFRGQYPRTPDGKPDWMNMIYRLWESYLGGGISGLFLGGAGKLFGRSEQQSRVNTLAASYMAFAGLSEAQARQAAVNVFNRRMAGQTNLETIFNEEVGIYALAMPQQKAIASVLATGKNFTPEVFSSIAEKVTGKTSMEDMNYTEAYNLIERLKLTLPMKAPKAAPAAESQLTPETPQAAGHIPMGQTLFGDAIQGQPSPAESAPAPSAYIQMGQSLFGDAFNKAMPTLKKIIPDTVIAHAQRRANAEKRNIYILRDKAGRWATRFTDSKDAWKTITPQLSTAARTKSEIQEFNQADDMGTLRKRFSDQHRTALIESDAYQAELQGYQYLTQKLSESGLLSAIDFGDLRTEALEYAEGKPQLKKYIAKPGEGVKLDEIGQAFLNYEGDITADWMDPAQVLEVLDAYESTKGSAKTLNRNIMRKVLKNGGPEIHLNYMVFDMLDKGFSQTQINDAVESFIANTNQAGYDMGNPADYLIGEQTHGQTNKQLSDGVPAGAGETGSELSEERHAIQTEAAAPEIDLDGVFDFEDENEALNAAKRRDFHKRGGFLDNTPFGSSQKAMKALQELQGYIDQLNAQDAQDMPQDGLGAAFYNHNNTIPKEGLAEQGKSLFEKGIAGLDKYLGTLSTRIINISKRLFYDKIQRHDFELRKLLTRYHTINNNFERAIRGFSKPDRIRMEYAQLNASDADVEFLCRKYGITELLNTYRAMEDEIFSAAQEVGFDMHYLEAHYARTIKKGKIDDLLAYLQADPRGIGIQQMIDQRQQKLGRPLTEDEKAAMVNVALRGYTLEQINLARPGWAKARTIPKVEKDIAKFFEPMVNSRAAYIDRMTSQIAARRFFSRQAEEMVRLRTKMSNLRTRLSDLIRLDEAQQGQSVLKDRTDYQPQIRQVQDELTQAQRDYDAQNTIPIGDTIGGWMNDQMAGGYGLTAQQQRDLKHILTAYFQPIAPGGFISGVIAYNQIEKLSQFTNIITQLGELIFSLKESPLGASIHALRALAGKSRVSLHDIHIESIGQEFTEETALQKIRNVALMGMSWMDEKNKQVFINTVLDKYTRLARSENPKAIEKLKTYFGDNYDFVLDNLQRGEITDDVKYFLFCELAQIQPITKLEVPEGYLRGGNARLLYSLQTFTIKRLDTLRRQGWNLIRDGYKDDDKKKVAKGIGTLLYLGFLYVLSDSGIDVLKDMLRGRPLNIRATVTDNLFQIFLFSKYSVDKAIHGRPTEELIGQYAPAFPSIDRLVQDARNLTDPNSEKYMESTRSIPLIGEAWYWWFGEGRRKIDSGYYQDRPNRGYSR